MTDIRTRNIRRFITSGQQDGFVQTFYNNNFVVQNMSDSSPNVYDIPEFSSSSGTLAFYDQDDLNSIFAIYAKPYIRVNFSGNTSIFTGDSRFRKFVVDLYKIDYPSLSEHRNNSTIDGYKSILKKIQTPIFSYSADSPFTYWQFYDNFYLDGNVGFSSLTETHNFQSGDTVIVYQHEGFTNPQYEGEHTISAVTDSYSFVTNTPWGGDTPIEGGRVILSSVISSGITYDFYPSQFYKPKNQYTQLVFEDRSQYFFNISYLFQNTGNTFLSTYNLSGSDDIIPFAYSASTFVSTVGQTQTITQGEWSGNTCFGLFFTCFTPPNKPIIEFPFPPTGETSRATFTPIFNFSNIEDGDRYVFQLTYNMADSGFTETSDISGKTSYYFEKDEVIAEEMIEKTNQVEVGSESSTSKKIRRFSAPIKPGLSYWYRIGNIKNIIDIFNVKREIINFSDTYSATSSSRSVIELSIDSVVQDEATREQSTTIVNSGFAQNTGRPE